MKKLIIGSFIVLVVALLTPQISQAQGTITYLSNLGQPSADSDAIGSDSWIAILFKTGSIPSIPFLPFFYTYTLNSVQIEMTDASGNPSGFTATIYPESGLPLAPPRLGSSLGTLNGSTDPSAAGIYTYTPASSLTLSQQTTYFIVFTAETTVANGAYGLNESATHATASGGWAGGQVLHSSNGSSGWSSTPYLGIAQFAITATAIPEPSPSFLILLGSGVLIYVRRVIRR